MGLDATAHERAEIVADHDSCPDYEYEAGWCSEHTRAFVIHPRFARSLDGLVDEGWYSLTGDAVHVGNPYTTHRRLREQVCRFASGVDIEAVWAAGGDGFDDLPFLEWLDFADNEGTVGGTAARRLADDFDAHDATDWKWTSPYDAKKWGEWGEAFHVASDTGLIRFA